MCSFKIEHLQIELVSINLIKLAKQKKQKKKKKKQEPEPEQEQDLEINNDLFSNKVPIQMLNQSK